MYSLGGANKFEAIGLLALSLTYRVLPAISAGTNSRAYPMQRSFSVLALVASATAAAPLLAQDSTSQTTTTVITTTTKTPVATDSTMTPEQRTAAALNSRTHVPLIIPAGTPIKVVLDRDISSASVNAGDTVSFSMAADFSEYNHVLISQGTKVQGIVSNVDRRSAGGDPGDVTLQVESVRSVDGQMIPLRGTKKATGKNRQAQATTLAILTLGLGATKKGASAVMAAGTEVTVYTDAKATIVVPR